MHYNNGSTKAKGKIVELSVSSERKRDGPDTIEWSKIYICPFSRMPKSQNDGGLKERLASKPSRNFGCTATINVQKKIGDEKIIVIFENTHTGHGVSTIDTCCRSRICPAVRVWLEKVVARGIDWTSFKRMTGPYDDQVGFLGIEGISLGQEVEVF